MFSNPLIWMTDIAILLGVWLLGILVIRALIPASCFPEQLSAGFGLGVGIITWLLFVGSWVGIPITTTAVLVVYLLAVLICVIVIWKGGGRKFLSAADPERAYSFQGIPDFIGWFLLTVFGLFILLLSVGLSYYFWDAMAIWSVKGYGIGIERSITGALNWGAKGLAYPLNIPLAISIFYVFDQDLLPGSKLLFPGFFISMLIGLRVLFYRQKLSVWFAWFAVFAVATTPLLLQYSMIGYVNIPYACYYVLGIIYLMMGLEGKKLQQILLGALLLSFSIWTRLEGLEFWFIAVISIALIWKKRFFEKQILLRILIPALVVGGSWIIFGWIFNATTGETTLLVEALSRLMQGEIQPVAVYQILRFTAYLVIKTHIYGILVPVMVSLGMITVLTFSEIRKDKIAMTLLVSGIFTGIGVIFMYYLTSYDQSSDLYSWLGTGYDRMLFPSLVLLTVASSLIIWKAWFRETISKAKEAH